MHFFLKKQPFFYLAFTMPEKSAQRYYKYLKDVLHNIYIVFHFDKNRNILYISFRAIQQTLMDKKPQPLLKRKRRKTKYK